MITSLFIISYFHSKAVYANVTYHSVLVVYL